MDILYKVILYLHVSSAVLSIGPFFILVYIVKGLKSAGSESEKTYIQLFWITVRLVKHAGHVLVGSGVLLIIYSGWTWTTSWVIATLIVMFGSVFFLARAFSPALKKFDEHNPNREVLIKQLTKSVWIYILLLMLMLWFMVAKPVLW